MSGWQLILQALFKKVFQRVCMKQCEAESLRGRQRQRHAGFAWVPHPPGQAVAQDGRQRVAIATSGFFLGWVSIKTTFLSKSKGFYNKHVYIETQCTVQRDTSRRLLRGLCSDQIHEESGTGRKKGVASAVFGPFFFGGQASHL